MSFKGLIYGIGAAAASLAVAGAVMAQQPARTGEQVMNNSCGSCHEYTVIQTSAKSEAEWKATIDQMIEKGATVPDAERPVLLAYLTRTHGPMPDGPGKSVVLNTCTICHDLTRIKRSQHTMDEWEDILIAMLNEGAPLSDDDFPAVLTYLTRNFGLK